MDEVLELHSQRDSKRKDTSMTDKEKIAKLEAQAKEDNEYILELKETIKDLNDEIRGYETDRRLMKEELTKNLRWIKEDVLDKL